MFTVSYHYLLLYQNHCEIILIKIKYISYRYFEIMMSFCKDDPQKVLDLPPELLQSLLTSIELGLFSFSHDVSMLCCNMIEILITDF